MATIKEQAAQLEQLIDKQNRMGMENPAADSTDTLELEEEPQFDLDYNDVKKSCTRRARKTIKNLISHVMSEDIQKEEYVQDKIKQDVESLSDLYYQKSLINTILKSNIENIRMGDASPRMYETCVQISKNLTDLNKQIIATETVMRQMYQVIKHEIIQKKNEERQLMLQKSAEDNALPEGSSSTKSNVVTGSNDLIAEQMKKKKERALQEIEDAEYDEV